MCHDKKSAWLLQEIILLHLVCRNAINLFSSSITLYQAFPRFNAPEKDGC